MTQDKQIQIIRADGTIEPFKAPPTNTEERTMSYKEKLTDEQLSEITDAWHKTRAGSETVKVSREALGNLIMDYAHLRKNQREVARPLGEILKEGE